MTRRSAVKPDDLSELDAAELRKFKEFLRDVAFMSWKDLLDIYTEEYLGVKRNHQPNK